MKKKFLLLIFIITLAAVIGWVLFNFYQDKLFQDKLQPFYNYGDVSDLPVGELLKKEPLDITVPGGDGYRILYVSEDINNKKVISSGMLFVPSSELPKEGRKVVAWAHGTIGMGDQCAPSRQPNPITNIPWVSEMLQRGFVVVATDYAGLGTSGENYYLIGESEARDVLNSVRAARNFPGLQASNKFALWGHSQGGHSVLFSGNLASSYAPELSLRAVAAAAPAAQLTELMTQQYKGVVSWVIGPDIMVSFPKVYKNLPTQVISDSGLSNYKRLALECTTPSSIEAIIRNKLGQSFFSKDPTKNPDWQKALTSQTPSTLSKNIPLLIIQGLADTVVLPDTTSLYIQRSCAAGTNLSTLWLGDTNHLQTALVAGPSVAAWIEERFNGVKLESTCNQEHLPL